MLVPISVTAMVVERHYQSADGRHIFESHHDIDFDLQGFAWLATESGLLRYDGVHARRFGIQDGMSSEFVSAVKVDKLGRIWAATSNGANMFDPVLQKFTLFFENVQISDIAQRSSGELIFASVDGLKILSKDLQTIVEIRAGDDEYALSSNTIRSVFVNRQDDVWVGYRDSGLSFFKVGSKTFEHYLHDPNKAHSIPGENIAAIAEDAYGQIWVSVWGRGLAILKNEKFVHFKPGGKHGIKNAIITDLFLDRQGRMWVSADKGGMYLYQEQTNSFANFRHDPFYSNSLISDTLRKIGEDHQGNLWFLSFPFGINRFNPQSEQFRQWQHHPFDVNSLNHSAVLSLLQGQAANVWVGTELGLNSLDLNTGDVHRFDYELDSDYGLPAPPVTAINYGPSGKLWVGTWSGGLARLEDDGLWKQFNDTNADGGFPRENAWVLFLDSRKRLWVGTETRGLYRYFPDSDSFIQVASSHNSEITISGNFILDIKEDGDGKLWLATVNGINCIDPDKGSVNIISSAGGIDLNAMQVRALHIDERERIWLVTQTNGVVVWDRSTDSAQVIARAHGLPSEHMATLVADGKGGVWLSSVQGIARVDVDTLKVNAVLRHSDGLIGESSNRNALLLTKDGMLVVGTVSGLVSFNVDDFSTDMSPPRPELSSLKVLGERVRVGDAGMLPRAITHAHSIHLPSSAKMFELEFSNVNFSYGRETQFQYRMLGYDEKWMQGDGEVYARYSNLSPGHYEFQLRALNKIGQPSENIRTLEVSIAPPIWRTPTAYLLYTAFWLAVLFLLVRLLLLKAIARNLQARVEEKTQALIEASDSKSRFIANLAHELRTPLNAIIAYSQQLSRKYGDGLEARVTEGLSTIESSGIHLNNLINDILDLSKVESGKMEIKPVECVVDEIVLRCIRELSVQAESKQLSISKPKIHFEGLAFADPQRLMQIIHNLLSNAIKYTDEGSIDISVEPASRDGKAFCAIRVKDTGKGISRQDQATLFTRFNQFDEKTKYMQGYGTGLGLAIVEEFTALQNGYVEVDSELGVGSTFSVLVPAIRD
jgi:two-component system sensor histidine kinase ChiS